MRGLRLTEVVRMRVKQPLGRLIIKPPDTAMEILKEIIIRENPTKLISVGDFVTSNMMKHAIKVDLFIIDNKIMRKPVKHIFVTKDLNVLEADNPPGMITEEALEATKKGVEDPSISYILINGEEDLLTLPIIKFAPEGAIIVYGQPHVGIVVVRVTEKKRREIEALMKRMEVVDED